MSSFQTGWAVRVATDLIACAASLVSAAEPPKDLEGLVARSSFVFEGAVIGPAAGRSVLVHPDEAAIAVRIESVRVAPSQLGTREELAGTMVILRLQAGAAAPPASRRQLFFANVALVQSDIVASEVGRVELPADRAPAMMAAIAVAPGGPASPLERIFQATDRLRFQDRVAAAKENLVVVGEVTKVQVAPSPVRPRFISEHDPDWMAAVIAVEGVIQGDGRIDRRRHKDVVIQFPASLDVAWRDAPKFQPRDAGMWNLRGSVGDEHVAMKAFAVAGDAAPAQVFTALDNNDFLPLTADQRKEILAAPKMFLDQPRTLIPAVPKALRKNAPPAAPAPAAVRPQAAAAPAREVATTTIGQAAEGVLVVNMVPRGFSSETGQDSEPFLAVHSADPRVLLGSAFTRNPTAGGASPVFVSLDGGENWMMNFTVPAAGVADQTYSFANDGGPQQKLFGSIIERPGMTVPVLAAADPQLAAAMSVISDFSAGGELPADQPFITARAQTSGDRIYVGENNFASNLGAGRTAAVRVSVNGGATFKILGLEARQTVGQDAPSVRPAVARDGTVYAAFIRWTSQAGAGTFIGDVIVSRDDLGATQAPYFRSLRDPSDQAPGRIVVQAREFPFGSGRPQLGKERIGSSLSLAVDPNDSAKVYVAWADRQAGVYTIHVRKSVDRGATWSGDVQTIPSATNPALAVADDGTVAFLFQQLVQRGTNDERWETHLRRSRDGFASAPNDLVLARTRTTDEPAVQFLPYLGDYAHVLAVGTNFYGVFAANNKPVGDHFPVGAKYQRNVQGGKLVSPSGSREVPPSIDPFFFRVATGSQPPIDPTPDPAPDPDPPPATHPDKTAVGTITRIELLSDEVVLELTGSDPARWKLSLDRNFPDSEKRLVQALLLADAFLRKVRVELSGVVAHGVGTIASVKVRQ